MDRQRRLPEELLFDSASSLRSAAGMLQDLQNGDARTASVAPALTHEDLLLQTLAGIAPLQQLIVTARRATDAAAAAAEPAQDPLICAVGQVQACLDTLDARLRGLVEFLEIQLLATDGAG